jgi:hypothetical protein
MGMDWWLKNPDFVSRAVTERAELDHRAEIHELKRRIAELERAPAPREVEP